MSAVDCVSARLWMQAPDGLTSIESGLLASHVDACGECQAKRDEIVEVDSLIRQSLAVSVADVSVRSQVLHRLNSSEFKTGRKTLRTKSRLSRQAFAVSAAFVLAALIGLGAPQILPDLNSGGSSAGATAWHRVNANVGFHVAVDPNRRNHLLSGIFNQVYQSWNAGGSWQPLARLPRGSVLRALAFDGGEANRYLAATRHSIYLSVDAGHHWRAAATGLPGALNMFLIQDRRLAGVFYVGPSVLWKSADHGSTWFKPGQGRVFAPDGIQSLAIGGRGTLYSGIWDGGVAISRDGGQTWHRYASGLRKNVMDVAASDNHTIWAATDTGTYVSRDGGQNWRQVNRGFFTSVLTRPAFVLVGGRHALYRSTDDGRTWQLAMNGLALDPYVNDMVADPTQTRRVYVSLNGDGLFRSDDGGQHWTGINNGIPVQIGTARTNVVLFRRNGQLWNTNTYGTDPGNLTVDHNVKAAALSPDGAAIAYIAVSSPHWWVRVLSAGGSAAHTVIKGQGPAPSEVVWSVDSSMIASQVGRHIFAANPAGVSVRWIAPKSDKFLGWASSGHDLLFWRQPGGRLIARSWLTGYALPTHTQVRVGVAPALAPDGVSLAVVVHGRLLVGSRKTGIMPERRVGDRCAVRFWSHGSNLIFLTCAEGSIEVHTRDGKLVGVVSLRGVSDWQPGPDGTVLLSRGHSLWVWARSYGLRVVAPNASPA